MNIITVFKCFIKQIAVNIVFKYFPPNTEYLYIKTPVGICDRFIMDLKAVRAKKARIGIFLSV